MLVVLLLDVSSSMDGPKISTLNVAVKEMLDSFKKLEAEILVSAITFGGDVEMHMPYTEASKIEWKNVVANGNTPMGEALKMAKAMIEDKEKTLSRAYRPVVILVSDGQPNDAWEVPLQAFITEGRSSKCDRLALAIGQDADESVLHMFLEGTENELFTADKANKIHEFFKWVTMSVSMRSLSKNPNLVPTPSNIKLDSKKPSQASTSSGSEGFW